MLILDYFTPYFHIALLLSMLMGPETLIRPNSISGLLFRSF